MIELYHGTASADAIIRTGKITVDPPIRNWTTPGKVPTTDTIHLTNNKISAEFYGLRSAVVAKKQMYSILKVRIDENFLYPDENYISPDIMAHEVPAIRKSIRENKDKWKLSLERCAGASLYESIPAEQIVSIETKLNQENVWWFLVEDSFTEKEFECKFAAIKEAKRQKIDVDWTTHKLVLINGDYGGGLVRIE